MQTKNIDISLSLIIFSSLLLFGCIGYNPPKYACECKVWCDSYSYGPTEYITTAGNDTIETTKASCEQAGIAWCGEGRVINYTCNPMSWNDYMKKVGERNR
jgi:hypothetical protein